MPKNIVVEFENDTLNEWLNGFSGKKINVMSGSRGIYRRLLDMANSNASEYLNKSIEKNKIIVYRDFENVDSDVAKLNYVANKPLKTEKHHDGQKRFSEEHSHAGSWHGIPSQSVALCLCRCSKETDEHEQKPV